MKPRNSYDRNQRLPIVAKVIKADSAFITGKFETKAQILAMKPKVCWRPQLLYPGKSIKEILFHTKKTLQASPLESQRVNKSKFLKNYFAAS